MKEGKVLVVIMVWIAAVIIASLIANNSIDTYSDVMSSWAVLLLLMVISRQKEN